LRLYRLGETREIYCHDFVGDGEGGWYADFSFAKDSDE